MCNCGKKRSQYATQHSNSSVEENTSQQPLQSGYTNFEYTGKTALHITGNYTRRNYRFHRPGDVQPVDNLDAGGMVGIPVLKRII